MRPGLAPPLSFPGAVVAVSVLMLPAEARVAPLPVRASAAAGPAAAAAALPGGAPADAAGPAAGLLAPSGQDYSAAPEKRRVVPLRRTGPGRTGTGTRGWTRVGRLRLALLLRRTVSLGRAWSKLVAITDRVGERGMPHRRLCLALMPLKHRL